MAERIVSKDLGAVMKPRYKTYALSVIGDRALPDLKTGLKPVLNRGLYSTYDMRVRANVKHKKSA